MTRTPIPLIQLYPLHFRHVGRCGLSPQAKGFSLSHITPSMFLKHLVYLHKHFVSLCYVAVCGIFLAGVLSAEG